jgi:hypothetical protein
VRSVAPRWVGRSEPPISRKGRYAGIGQVARYQRPDVIEFLFGCSMPLNVAASHLALRGAPPRAIQELAGHRELGMTQRYMHLSPAALDSAIRLLDQPFSVQSLGDILETGRVSEEKITG